MAQLDKLLAAMMSNHASALVLTEGEVVKLEIVRKKKKESVVLRWDR